MKAITKSAIVLGLLCSTFVACKKSDNTTSNTATADDKASVQDVAFSDQVSTDMEQAYDEGLTTSNNGVMVPMNGIVLGPCVTVTLTQTATLKTLTIDFGTQGCLCGDGKTRKGKLIATASNFNQINVVRTLTTDNYYVNDYHVDGTITRDITNNVDSTTREAQIVESLTITNPSATNTYSRTATLTRIFHFGVLGNPVDNTNTSWGDVHITRPNGNQITRSVAQSTPLFFKNSCHQIVSGIEHLVNVNHNITVDFGNGDCDNQATVSNGTTTWTINL